MLFCEVKWISQQKNGIDREEAGLLSSACLFFHCYLRFNSTTIFFFFWSRFAISSFLQFVAFLTGLHLVQSTIYKLNLSALLQWPPSAYLSRTPLMLQTRTVRHWNFLTVLSYKMVVQRIQNMCIFLERPQNKHTQLNYHGGLTGLQEYTLEF